MRRAVIGLPATALLLTAVSAGPALAEPPAPPSTQTARTELARCHHLVNWAAGSGLAWARRPAHGESRVVRPVPVTGGPASDRCREVRGYGWLIVRSDLIARRSSMAA